MVPNLWCDFGQNVFVLWASLPHFQIAGADKVPGKSNVASIAPCFTKSGPRTSSLGISRSLLRNAESWAHPDSPDQKSVRASVSDVQLICLKFGCPSKSKREFLKILR